MKRGRALIDPAAVMAVEVVAAAVAAMVVVEVVAAAVAAMVVVATRTVIVHRATTANRAGSAQVKRKK